MWSRLGVRTPGDNEEPRRGFEDIALSPTASGLSGRVSAPPATVGTTIASGSSEGSSGGVQMRSRFRPVTSLGFTQPQGERSESLEGKLREEGGSRRHDNVFGSLSAVGSVESQRFGMGLSTRSSQEMGSSQVIARRGTGITPVPEDVPPTVAVFRTPSINSNLTRDMMQDSGALWEDPPGREGGESRRQDEHAHRQKEHGGQSGSVATGYGTVGGGQADAGAGTDDGLVFDSTDMDPFGAAPASPAGPGVSVTDSFASEAFSGRPSQAFHAPVRPDFGFKGPSGATAGASSALESSRGGHEGVGSVDRTSPGSYAAASTVGATTSFDTSLQRSRLSGAATLTGATEAARASPLETLRGSTPVESFSSSTPEARTSMWQSSSPAAHTLSPALQGRYSLTSPRPESSTSLDHRQTPSPSVGVPQQAGGFTLGSSMGAGDAVRRSPYTSDMSRLLQSPPVDIYSYGSPASEDIGGGDRRGGLFDRQQGTAASISPAFGAVEQRPPSATAGLHRVSEYGGSAQQEAVGMYEEEQDRYEQVQEHEYVQPPPVNMEGTEVVSNAGLTADEARIDSYGLRSPFAGNQSPPALRFGFQHGVGGDGDVDSFASRPHSQPHMPLTSRSDVSNASRPSSSTATQPPHPYVPSAQTDEGTASPKTSVDYFGGSTTSSVPSPTPTQFVELRGALTTGADSPMGPGSPPPGGVLGSSVRASPNSTLRSSPVASTVQHSPPLAPSSAPASESDYGSRSASRANSPPPEFTLLGGDGGDHLRSFGSDDGGSGGSGGGGGGGGGKYSARPAFITPEHTTSPRAPRPLASPFPPHRREPDRQQSTDFWKGAVCDTVTRSGAFDSFDESGGSSQHRGDERREAEARGHADDRRQPTLMSEPSVQAVPDDLFGTPAGVDGGWSSAYNSPMRRVLTPPPAPQRRSETPVKDASQLFGSASPEAEKSPRARTKTPVVTGLSSSAFPFNDSSGAADDVNGIFGAEFQQPHTGNLRGADACFSPTGIGGGDTFGFQATSSFANRAASPARDMAFTAFNYGAPPPPPAPAQASYDPFGAAKTKSPGRTTEHASFGGPTSPYGNGGFGTHPPAFAPPERSTAVKDAVRGLAGALASDEPLASGSESYFSSGDRGQGFGVSASFGSGAELERVGSPGRRSDSPQPAATEFGGAVGSHSPRPGRQSFFEQPPAGLSSSYESHPTNFEAATAAFTPRDLFASSLSSTHRGAFDAPPLQEPSHFAATDVSMGEQLASLKTPPPYVASAVASSVVPSPPPPPRPGPIHPPDNVIAYNTSPPRASSHLTSPRAEHATVSSPAYTRQHPPALISPKVRAPYDPSLKLASPSLAAPARPLSPVMPAQAPSAGGTLNVVPDNIFGGDGEDVFGGDLAGEFGYNAGHNDFSAGPPGQDAHRHALPAAHDPFLGEHGQDGFSYEAPNQQSFGLPAEQDAYAGFASGGHGEVRGAQQQQQQSLTGQEAPHGDGQPHPFLHHEQHQHQQHPFHQQLGSYLSSTQQQQQQQQQTSYFSQPHPQQQPQGSYLSPHQERSPAVPQGGYLTPQQPSHSTPQAPPAFGHPYSAAPKPTYQHPSHVATEQHADGAVMFDMDRTPSQPQQPTGAPSWQQAALPHPLIASPSKSPVKTLGGPTALPLSVPHSAPRSHEGGLAFPLTGMQRSSKEERSMRRPVWAPTSFAVSGKMVYMLPERARLLSGMGGVQGNDEGYKKGPLRVKKLRFDVCSYFSDDWFAKVLCIDSPLTALRVARPRLKDFSLDPAERLLWGLVDAAARNHGQLSTGKGLGDPDSLEREILGLIVPPADHKAFARGTGTTPKKADTPKARAFEAIEKAVMEGSLEVAVKVAEDADMFADAMILSAVLSGCAGEKKALQDVIRNYANRHVEPGSALHTLYIHASGQAGSALVCGGKPLAVVGPGGQQYHQQQQQQQQGGLDATVVKNWRRNLAALYVACQTDASAYNTMRIFGDRLKTEGMTSAAHAAYLLSGMDPGEDQASWESRFFLIGVDVDRGTEAAMWSERSVDAFLRTECWHVARRGAISKLVHYTKNTKLPLSTIKFQEYKLQFASVLADSGDIPRAKAYLESLRHVLGPWVNTSDQFANDEVNRYPRQLASGVTSPFSVLLLKKYANLAEYFLEPAKSKSGTGTTLFSQAGNFVVSTIKKHVHAGTGDEAPSSVQTPPTSSGGGVATAGTHASHHHTMSSTDLGGSPPVPTRVVRSASYGQQTATSTLHPAFEHRPQAPPSTPPMHGSYHHQQQQQHQQDIVSPGVSNGVPQVLMWNPAAVSGAPHRTASGVNLAAYGSTDGKPPRSGEKVFSPGHPFTQWSPNASAPRVGELSGQAPLSGSGGSSGGQHHDAYSLGAPMDGGVSTDGMMQDIPLNDGPGSVPAPAPFAPPHRSSSMQHLPGKIPPGIVTEHRTPAPSSDPGVRADAIKEDAAPAVNKPGSRSQPTSQPSSAKSTPNHRRPSAGGAEGSQGGNKGSVLGWIGKTLGIKTPVVADVGQEMKAYFDKDKGRWVFPGEEDNPEADAALAPPPTSMPVQGASEAMASGSPMGPPPGGYGSNSAPPSFGAGPPGGGNTSSAASDDPLAALMAPPPMRGLPSRRPSGGSIMQAAVPKYNYSTFVPKPSAAYTSQLQSQSSREVEGDDGSGGGMAIPPPMHTGLPPMVPPFNTNGQPM